MEQIEGVLRDLESLKNRLQTMPDKTTHQVMVPIGDHAPGKPPLLLMPGRVKHTNEILVLLGDNWFVERSAKEASQIADRRINKAKDIIENLKKEKTNHEQWIKTLKELADEQADHREIREEFDEKAESEWRKKHREKVREAKLKEKKEKKLPIDEDLMKRLEELELEEAESGENENAHFDWRREVAKMEQEDKKKVRFKEEVTVAPEPLEVPVKVPEPVDAIGSVVEREQNVPAKPPKAPRGGKGKNVNSSFGKFNK